MRKSVISSLFLVAVAVFVAAEGVQQGPPIPPYTLPIAVSSTLPPEPPGGFPGTDLAHAAQFAWEEFIALNWPAIGSTSRDNPSGLKFGQTGYTGPVVWQTYRHKVELFPGQGNPPGYVPTAPSYGYDAPPQYTYGPAASPAGTGQVQACSGQTPVTTPAWVNLDETSQIGLDQMYAGTATTSPLPGQQILFLAKANRAEYSYMAANKWWGQTDPPYGATANYIQSNKGDPPAGSPTYVSFPNGTIEVKTAWRRLTSKEAGSGQVLMSPVRFYETLTQNGKKYPCYREEQWGMLALHIIQKTASAPYFVFATFEQASNMLDQTGNPIEAASGALSENQNAPALNPNQRTIARFP